MKLPRKVAERIIDDMRVLATTHPEVARVLASYGLQPLELCTGEAHSEPNIDHCLQCAPRWGWVGERAEVK